MQYIDDMYWFEENHVHENGDGYGCENIIMQFTGLHDKNGKEIYEGDIVEETDVYSSATHIVRYVHYGFYACDRKRPMNYKWLSDNGKSYALAFLGGQRLTIIGNIYENPELLK
jgi:uncharacterized phage protein (TIGR01671 family)